MKLRTNVFDLWVFSKKNKTYEYLLFYTSQEKANKWFFGNRFWQIPGGFTDEDQDPVHAIREYLQGNELSLMKIWAVEYTYTYYNARRKNIEIVPVFASEVVKSVPVKLTWEHSEYGWFSSEECFDRISFRGLVEGLQATCKYVTESKQNSDKLRLL